jgi:hypothetical protein
VTPQGLPIRGTFSEVTWRLVVSNTGTRSREDAVGCRASQLITAAAGQGALCNVLSEWRLTLDAQAVKKLAAAAGAPYAPLAANRLA